MKHWNGGIEVQTLKLKRLMGNQKGLTLIELLAVVVVLGIILAIAVPSVMGVISRSKVQADVGSLKLVREAGLRYALANDINTPSTTVAVSKLVEDGFLNSVPKVQSKKVSAFGAVIITLSGNSYSVDVYESETPGATDVPITPSKFTDNPDDDIDY